MKNTKIWIITIVILTGSFYAMYALNKSNNTNELEGTKIESIISDTEWIKGNEDSSIILVEYSDFQCPACKARESLIDELINEFGNHIKFVYKHRPLSSIHANAQLTAQASEAAGLQNAFWEMHDLLFEKQSDWSKLSQSDLETTLTSYAEELNLDIEQFTKDLNSNSVKDAVEKDLSEAENQNINSTPIFVLNGEIVTASSHQDYRTTIQEAINNK